VLASDTDFLAEQAEAYEALVESAKPLAIADAPKMGSERVQFPSGGASFEAEGRASAYVLSLDGQVAQVHSDAGGRKLSVAWQGTRLGIPRFNPTAT